MFMGDFDRRELVTALLSINPEVVDVCVNLLLVHIKSGQWIWVVLHADVTLLLAEHVEQVRSKSLLIKLTLVMFMMSTRGRREVKISQGRKPYNSEQLSN